MKKYEEVIPQSKVHAELEREAAENSKANLKQNTDAVNLPNRDIGRVSEQMAEKLGISEKTYRDRPPQHFPYHQTANGNRQHEPRQQIPPTGQPTARTAPKACHQCQQHEPRRQIPPTEPTTAPATA